MLDVLARRRALPRHHLFSSFGLLALACPPALAQTWSRLVPHGESTLVVLRAGSGGTAWGVTPGRLLHFGPAGDVRSVRGGLGWYSVLPLPDGSLWSYGATTLRLDASGTPLEVLELGEGLPSSAISGLVATSDGGLLVLGSEWQDHTTTRGAVARFDGAGDVVWARRLVAPLSKDGFSRLPAGGAVEVPGGYVVSGDSTEGAFVAALDAAGAPRWVRALTGWHAVFLEPASGGDVWFGLARTLDGHGRASALVRFDAAGRPLASRVARDAHFHDGVVAPDGTLWLAGERGEEGGASLLARVDAQGALLSARTFGIATQDRLLSIDADAAGLYVAGHVAQGPLWDTTMLFARLDPDGDGLACAARDVPLELVDEPLPWTPLALALGPLVVRRGPTDATLPDLGDPSRPGCFGLLGTTRCAPAVPNSTGLPAVLEVRGFDAVFANAVRLRAADMPPWQFATFRVGQGTEVVRPPGAQGRLCLRGAPLGRFPELSSTGANEAA